MSDSLRLSILPFPASREGSRGVAPAQTACGPLWPTWPFLALAWRATLAHVARIAAQPQVTTGRGEGFAATPSAHNAAHALTGAVGRSKPPTRDEGTGLLPMPSQRRPRRLVAF